MPPSAALLNHLFPHTADVFHILLRIFGRVEYIRFLETNAITSETTHVAGNSAFWFGRNDNEDIT